MARPAHATAKQTWISSFDATFTVPSVARVLLPPHRHVLALVCRLADREGYFDLVPVWSSVAIAETKGLAPPTARFPRAERAVTLCRYGSQLA